MNRQRFADESVEVRTDGDRVVVSVRGDVDALSAPLLRSVMGGVVEHGHRDVVVDLADVTFMSAAGLGILAEASSRLTSVGRKLHVRSASPMSMRLMRITHVDALVELESSAPDPERLGRGERAETSLHPVGGHPISFVSDLVRAGSMVAANAMVDATLQVVTVLAAAAVDGADGVSVSLERQRRLSTVAWSNETVLQMDLHQYETGEGPCLDAATTGLWFHIDSLTGENRWPSFVPRALDEGIASVLSTPLTTPVGSVGALNLYSNTEGAFGEPQLELAGVFAEQASRIISASLTDQNATARLARALVDREVIAQAQGVMMARRHISAIDAASHLFSAARAAEINVVEQAAIVVGSTAPDAGSDVRVARDE